MKILDGKKAYLGALGVILVGVGQFLTGDAALLEAVGYVFGGLGIAGIRHKQSRDLPDEGS